MKQSIVLVCTCGTMWRQAEIDEFNRGSVEFAAERHLNFWKMGKTAHRLYIPAEGKELRDGRVE